MYFLYNAALVLAFLLATPYWLYKMLRHGKYRAGLAERLGRVPERVRSAQPGDVCIWIHAVSVGEVLAISQLVNELRDSSGGKLRVVVSTTTTTGQNLARERFGAENVFYFPLDFGFCTRPYMRALRPKLVVMAETEFWPNFLRKAKRCGAQVAVVNARISDRSLPGYRRWKGILSRVLRNVDLFLAQSEEDKRRLIEIGAAPERVQVSGNLKFDIKPVEQAAIVIRLYEYFIRDNPSPIIVAGSTADPEEECLLNYFQALIKKYPRALLILAPRAPERFDEVATAVRGWRIPLVRRSTWKDERLDGAVMLLDSIGELASVYEVANLAFVGGSIAKRGGHNVLEPARFGVPIIVGENTENFRDIVNAFESSNALRRADRENLGRVIFEIVQDSEVSGTLGRNAKRIYDSNAGATARTAEALNQLLEAAQ